MGNGRQGRHVYCIIEAKEGKEFVPFKIDDGDGYAYAVGHQDVAAVLSDSPIIDYGSLARETVVRHLFSHQTVIENVMREYTVLPVKFPTVVESIGEAEQILENGYGLLKNALSLMSNKIEIDVTALWDKDTVFEDIYSQNEAVRELQERIAAQLSPQLETDKIELGKMIRSVLLERREKYGTEIVDFLGKQALALCYHEFFDDMMIINTSFLMEKHREDEFDQAVKEIDKKYQQKINFRCIGPLPAYSFSTVKIRKIDTEQVDQAKELLGLGDETTMSEIRKAYRRLACGTHPDKHPDEQQASTNFKRVTEAYELLQDYCQPGRCSFEDRDTKGLTLIKVLRNGEMN